MGINVKPFPFVPYVWSFALAKLLSYPVKPDSSIVKP